MWVGLIMNKLVQAQTLVMWLGLIIQFVKQCLALLIYMMKSAQ